MESMNTAQKQGDAPVEKTGRLAALLSAVEVGLGSLLHGLHVPLSGTFLSLNQAFLLSHAVSRDRVSPIRLLPFQASAIAAALKSLAPAGKKLTPMLAISVQGALFNSGTLLLGSNIVGCVLGSVFLSLWSFIQPVILYYVLFGSTLILALQKLLDKIHADLGVASDIVVGALLGLVLAKALLAVIVAVVAFRLSEARFRAYQNKLIELGKRAVPRSKPAANLGEASVLAARDLLRPLFLVSLFLTVVFFIWADSPRSVVIWGVLRPLALGFLVFLAIRIVPVENLGKRLETLHGPMGRAMQRALKLLKGVEN